MSGRTGWTLMVALVGLLLFGAHGAWWAAGTCACVFAFVLGRWMGRREAIAAAVAAIRHRGRTRSHADIARQLGK